MNDLTKLVQIVTNRHLKSLPLLNFNEKKLSKELKLFYDIQKGEVQSTPRHKKKEPDSAEVRMVRARLRKKLLNHLYFLNLNDSYLKVSYRADQECLNLIHQARILIKEGNYQISEKLLLNALKIAEDIELTSQAIAIIDLLRMCYVSLGNAHQFKKISKPLSHYKTIAEKEQEAEDLYFTVKLEVNSSVQAKKNFLPRLESIVSQLRQLWDEYRSFYLFELYYKTNIWYQELTNNFAQIIAIASETEELLEKGQLNDKRFDDRYNKYIKVYAYLRERRFEEGLEAAEQYTESFSRSSSNWFAFMENYFLLAMHAGKYHVANHIYNEVNNNAFFQKINRNARERWQLFRAYLYFISPSPELLKQFNYQHLMASVPEYSKDKEGFNVAILILQFLYFLKAREVEALLYRIESLKKYSGRHFKDSFSIRSQLFFKLLNVVIREDLDPDRCRRKGRALADKLAVTPAPGDAYAEIEIIPYEHLWEEILKMLAQKPNPIKS